MPEVMINGQKIPTISCIIEPDLFFKISGLYLGTYECVTDKDYLRSAGINAILTVPHTKEEAIPFLNGEFTHKILEIRDNPD